MVRYTIDKSDEVEEHPESPMGPEVPEKGVEGVAEGVQQLQLKEPPEDDLKAIARRVARIEGDVRDCRQKQREMEGKMVRMENWLHGSMDAVLRKLDSVIASQQRQWPSPPPGAWGWPGPWAWPGPAAAARAPTLLLAAESGDAEALLQLLAAGGAAADTEQRSARGDTPLHASAARGDARCLRLLLAAGASPRAPGHRLRTALHCAARRGHVDAALRLLDAGAQVDARDADGATPLALAAAEGHTNAVAMLLERGAAHDAADAKGLTPVFRAAAAGHERVLQLLLDKGASAEAAGAGEEGGAVSLVAHAAKAGQWGAVRLLLERGAKASQGESPLALAARAGQGGALRELLRRGALAFDDEQVEGALNVAASACAVWALAEAAPAAVRGEPGRWALLYAAEDGRLHALVALLEAGVDLASARDGSGITALHTAAWNGHWTVVRELLLRGADVLWKDGNGDTALHKAALADRQVCVRALLEAGGAAALGEKNKQGETPRDLAASDVVRRMLEEGVASAEYALGGGRKFPFGVPAAASGGTLFGTGTASGGTTFGAGTASGGTTFGAGTASGGTTFGAGTASGGTTFGAGTASGGTTFGAGTASGGTTFGAGTASGGTTFGAGTASGGTTFGAGTASGGTTFGAGTASGRPTFGGCVFGTRTASGRTTFGAATSSGRTTFGAATASGGTTFGVPASQAATMFGRPAANAGFFGSASENSPSKGTLFGSVSEQSNQSFGFAASAAAAPNVLGMSNQALNNGVFGSSLSFTGGNGVSECNVLGSGNEQLNCGYSFGIPNNILPPGNISGLGSQPSSNSGVLGQNCIPVDPNSCLVFGYPVDKTVVRNSPRNSAQNSGRANSLNESVQLTSGATANHGIAIDVRSQLSSNGDTGNVAGNDKVFGSFADSVRRSDNKNYSVSSGNTVKNVVTSSGGVQPANSVLNGGSLKPSPPEEGEDGAGSDSSSSSND